MTPAPVNIPPTQIPRIQRDPLAFLLENAWQYGDFIHFPLGLWNVYLLNDPALIKHVLQDNNRNYSKNTIQYNTLSIVTGRGLLTSDGETWRQQRRLIQPAFHRRRIAQFGELMTAATQKMVDRWDATSAPLDIDAEMMQLSLEIVGQALFSLDLSQSAGELTRAVLTMLDYVVYRASTPLAAPLWWPTRRNGRFLAARRLLNNVIAEMVQNRRAQLAAGQQPDDDLLTMLLEARDPESGDGMSDAQIRDEIITLLIAGHETVASALTWCWYLLAQHPEQLARLQEELDGVLDGRRPTIADLAQLPLTRAIFDETLRLYPPAWIITRRAIAADKLGDGEIPANGLILISPYVVHRHPGFWPEPEQFKPDRFLPGASDGRPRFAYIPFGGGLRLCIGDQFALTEAQLIIAEVARRGRLALVPDQKVVMEPLVTLRPQHGLWMIWQRRL
jgi:cytochrome P450